MAAIPLLSIANPRTDAATLASAQGPSVLISGITRLDVDAVAERCDVFEDGFVEGGMGAVYLRGTTRGVPTTLSRESIRLTAATVDGRYRLQQHTSTRLQELQTPCGRVFHWVSPAWPIINATRPSSPTRLQILNIRLRRVFYGHSQVIHPLIWKAIFAAIGAAGIYLLILTVTSCRSRSNTDRLFRAHQDVRSRHGR